MTRQVFSRDLRFDTTKAALARLDSRQLTEEEQREVWKNTRTPHKVNWPDWWTVSTLSN